MEKLTEEEQRMLARVDPVLLARIICLETFIAGLEAIEDSLLVFSGGGKEAVSKDLEETMAIASRRLNGPADHTEDCD